LSATSVLASLRRILAALFLATALGTATELLLVDHVEDFWQLLPLMVIALGTATFLAAARWPGVPTLQLHQTAMAVIGASGALGLLLHYRVNVEFEKEMYPHLGGFALFWKAIQGASPPSLAPGAMFVIGALGLAWGWKHPALRTPNGDSR